MEPIVRDLFTRFADHCSGLADEMDSKGDYRNANAYRHLALQMEKKILEATKLTDPLALARLEEHRFQLARREVSLLEALMPHTDLHNMESAEQRLLEARARLEALSPL